MTTLRGLIAVHQSIYVRVPPQGIYFEALVEEARRLLAEVEAHAVEVHVPALLLYEVGNIILMKTRLSVVGLVRMMASLQPFLSRSPRRPSHCSNVPGR